MLTMEKDKILQLMLEMSDAGKQLDQAIGSLAQVMNHLYKIKYAENNSYINDWKEDIDRNLEQAKKHCSDRNSVLSRLKNDEKNIKKAYQDSQKAYRKDARTDMKAPKTFRFPDDCPWTVDELFSLSVEELLSKLPDLEIKKSKR